MGENKENKEKKPKSNALYFYSFLLMLYISDVSDPGGGEKCRHIGKREEAQPMNLEIVGRKFIFSSPISNWYNGFLLHSH